MSTLHTRTVGTTKIHWSEYEDYELVEAWSHTNGQGNASARRMDNYCVVVPCTEEQAIKLSRMFVRRFAIPSCCYWNGRVLSMYCGDAGSVGWLWLKDDIERLVVGLKEWGVL